MGSGVQQPELNSIIDVNSWVTLCNLLGMLWSHITYLKKKVNDATYFRVIDMINRDRVHFLEMYCILASSLKRLLFTYFLQQSFDISTVVIHVLKVKEIKT